MHRVISRRHTAVGQLADSKALTGPACPRRTIELAAKFLPAKSQSRDVLLEVRFDPKFGSRKLGFALNRLSEFSYS